MFVVGNTCNPEIKMKFRKLCVEFRHQYPNYMPGSTERRKDEALSHIVRHDHKISDGTPFDDAQRRTYSDEPFLPGINQPGG